MRVTQSGHVKTGVDHMPYRGHTMFTYTGRFQTEVPTSQKLVLILEFLQTQISPNFGILWQQSNETQSLPQGLHTHSLADA